MSFAEILEAVDSLPLEKQIKFVDVIKKRIIEKKREIIYKKSKIALEEYSNNLLSEDTADALINRLSGNEN